MGNFLERIEKHINLLTFLISPGSTETYMIRLKKCNRFWFAVCFLKTRVQVDYSQHLTSGESILLVNVDVASAFLIWMIKLFTDKIYPNKYKTVCHLRFCCKSYSNLSL